MPGIREVKAACWAALAVTTALVALSICYGARDQPFLGHQPGGDFISFYVAGKILNEYPHSRLYNSSLQYRLHHAVMPEMPRETVEAYINTPFLASVFRPLARLPFAWSYGLWVAISAVLYICGLAVLWPAEKGFAEVSRIAFLACCSFLPFSIECLAGGQISAVGFFALALCTRWLEAYPLAAGAALSVCLYKPTLLVLVVPMLAIGRRFRTLAGFAAGACVLGALSVAAVGFEGCAAYLQALGVRAEWTARNPSPLPLYKFVDIHTFIRLLAGGHSAASAGTALILMAAAFAYLAVRWWRSRPGTPADGLLWAATIAWTLVFNLYVPIYDTILIVIAALVMAGAVYGSGAAATESDRAAFRGWMLALYAATCVSQAIAAVARFQMLTVVLAAIGFLGLRWSRRLETAGQ
jgi:hypothetical protein